jgi:putative transposase
LLGKIREGKMILNKPGKIANEIWLDLDKHFENILIDEFVVMPNHVHGIVMIVDEINSTKGLINQTLTGKNWIMTKNSKQIIGKIIRYYKGKTAFLIHGSGSENFKWQRNYYDHIIRNEKDLNAVREYIYYNPLKWELDKEHISE